jgi:Mg2+ and Co2+ transporter CorA
MLRKSVLKRCGMIGLLAFGILWTQMPVKAQEKSLEKQLAEAKAAIADQVWIIEQMKDNFFKVTGQLEAEIKKLRATNVEQARKIEEITNVYLRKIQRLGGELDRLKAAYTDLKATNVEQAQTIKQITDNFFKVTGKLGEELESLKAANA